MVNIWGIKKHIQETKRDIKKSNSPWIVKKRTKKLHILQRVLKSKQKKKLKLKVKK